MKPVIAVFAGSKLSIDLSELASIRAFARSIGEAGFDIIYGGGDQGGMGFIAKIAQDAGSHVTAVVLDKYAHETQIDGAAIVRVSSEDERFEKMTSGENIVAIVAFPGSVGTMREVMQGLEKAVYGTGCPVVLAGVGDCSDGIQAYFDGTVRSERTSPDKKDALRSWSEGDDLRVVLGLEVPTLPSTPVARKSKASPEPC